MIENILVIGSGDQHFREYALRGLAKRYHVLLIAQTPTSWQSPYAADYREVELADKAQVLAAAQDLAARHQVAGVITWDEMQVAVAAEVGVELGVPTMPVDAARTCRDKGIQRERFAAHDVPSARFCLADTLDTALVAARDIGYPVVVKPRGRAASIAVQLAGSDEELRRAFEFARGSENSSIKDGLVLVEEYLQGPEISVDCWVLDGRVEPYVLALKRTDYPPFFEEVAHVVGDVLDEQTTAAVRDVTVRAHRALGIDRTVTHTELMLTADGPKIIEVNGRLGGELIPYLAELCTPGFSVGEMVGAVATGRTPQTVAAPSRLMGIRFLYPTHSMVFHNLDHPAALADEPWVQEIRQVTEPGLQLHLPPKQFLGRAGFVIATADTVSEVDERLLALADKVSLVGTPLADQDQ
ncbi:ATP-grasp domain-containing protein [Streptomyces lunalinharesii]|uniref:ATP-grasp domain-containing protein n=1 Tax=Streptomyces lunalinharesii TaxID=333384 RepID=A0ABP6FE53_9ACTN